MVRNAIFTEPSDQSAWLYLQFLIGKDSLPVLLVDVVLLPLENGYQLFLVFNQPVKCLSKELILSNQRLEFNFETRSHLQVIECLDTSTKVDIEISSGAFCGSSLDKVSTRIKIDCLLNSQGLEMKSVSFVQESEPFQIQKDRTVWENELEHILELYELEPDSKWVMLMLLHLYQYLNKPPQLSIEILDKLLQTDPYRKGYYLDYRIWYLTRLFNCFKRQIEQIRTQWTRSKANPS